MLAVVVAVAVVSLGYPVDAGERTGIRRLNWQRRIEAGEARGSKLVPGAKLKADQVVLRLDTPAGRAFSLTEKSPRDDALQSGLEAVLRQGFRGYGVALVDMTDPEAVAFAAVRPGLRQTPGSVAKLLVATGFLAALADRVEDAEAREAFLRTTSYTADAWAKPDHHEVPVVGADGGARVRAVRTGDTFSAWEWLDHTLSPSSNAAASIVWREASYLAAGATTAAALDALRGKTVHAGARDAWARSQGREAMAAIAFEVVDGPLRSAGIEPRDFRLRSFFTRGAGRFIRASSSRATPLAVLQWAVALEQGRLVDRFTSLELKRLIYLTRRRIRYAFAPELRGSAVFFKSGSLYGCRSEPGYRCAKYRGNRINVLNSLAIVETPRPSKPPVVYAAVVMSNILKRNASYDHAVLAGRVHRLIEARHP